MSGLEIAIYSVVVFVLGGICGYFACDWMIGCMCCDGEDDSDDAEEEDD